MSKKEPPELSVILDAAQSFAHEFHTRKMFNGYTEAEVMKGAAALSIALNYFINAGILFKTAEEAQPFFDKLEATGIYIKGDKWQNIGEVFEILLKVFCTEGKGGASDEN